MRKNCGFERIAGCENDDTPMPKRATARAAGYDMAIAEDIEIPSHYDAVITLLYKRYTSPKFKKIIDSVFPSDIKSKFGKSRSFDKINEGIIKLIPDFLLHKTMDLEEIKQIIKESNLKLPLVPTNMKAFMEDDQRLDLYIRSSIPMSSYLFLGNGVGLVDADYYDNNGHIKFQILNLSPFTIKLKKGDIIGQAVFSTFDITMDDDASGDREGGFGSTNGK
jgi:dUTP pyrophosphatase